MLLEGPSCVWVLFFLCGLGRELTNDLVGGKLFMTLNAEILTFLRRVLHRVFLACSIKQQLPIDQRIDHTTIHQARLITPLMHAITIFREGLR